MLTTSTLLNVDTNETYLNDSDASSLITYDTFNSQETLTNTIFNSSSPISYYTLRNLPIVSNFLSHDIQLFRNDLDLAKYVKDNKSVAPVLSTSLSILNYFKVNSPFLTINRHTNLTEKSEFCKVYFKVLHKNLSCYVLVFNLKEGKKICLLLNNELKPYVDCIWENTKLRILGTSGTASTFGNGFIKVYILEKNYNTLTDEVEIEYKVNVDEISSPKDLKIKLPDPEENELLAKLFKHNRSHINQNLLSSKTMIRVPVGSFIDGNVKIKKYVKNGYLKLYDYNPVKEDEMSETGLVLSSILLSLRELETRKNKGSNKPTFTR